MSSSIKIYNLDRYCSSLIYHALQWKLLAGRANKKISPPFYGRGRSYKAFDSLNFLSHRNGRLSFFKGWIGFVCLLGRIKNGLFGQDLDLFGFWFFSLDWTFSLVFLRIGIFWFLVWIKGSLGLVFFRVGSPRQTVLIFCFDDDVKVVATTPCCNRINALFSFYGIYLPKSRFTKKRLVELRVCT